jgi:RNA polymerase sigma-70 factor (ECF subfamily)
MMTTVLRPGIAGYARDGQREISAEDALAARLAACELEAYDELVARYGDELYRYIYSVTGSHTLSQEAMGATCQIVLDQIAELPGSGLPLRPWLYRAAHRAAVAALERERQTLVLDGVGRVARPITEMTQRLGVQLESARVRDALEILTSEQRQVLLLRFVAELSPAEVAQVMGRGERAVRQLQWRALRVLTRRLGQRGDC